jgi:hypothetical protein
MKAAEDIAAKGTALLKELTKLLVRKDALSAAWLEDRSQLRAKVEAHLQLARRGNDLGQAEGPATIDAKIRLAGLARLGIR